MGGWLLAGHSRPSPPAPTSLPLELFLPAAPKERRGREGTALANAPSFMATESSVRVKENFGGGYASGAAPTRAVNHRPSPPFSPPSLPSPEARTPHLHGQGWLGAPRALRSPPGAGQAGWAAPSLRILSLLSSSVWRSRAALLGQGRQSEPQSARGKPRCRKMRAACPLWI